MQPFSPKLRDLLPGVVCKFLFSHPSGATIAEIYEAIGPDRPLITQGGAIFMQEFSVAKLRRCLEVLTGGGIVQVNRGNRRALKFTPTPAGTSQAESVREEIDQLTSIAERIIAWQEKLRE